MVSSASSPVPTAKRRSQRIMDQKKCRKTHHKIDDNTIKGHDRTTFNFAKIPAAAPSVGGVRMLLQPPRKWTLKHLEVARLKLIDNALPAEIVGDLVPKDDDAEYENAISFFCEPSRQELEGAYILNALRRRKPFSLLFSEFWRILPPRSPSRSTLIIFLKLSMNEVSGTAAGCDDMILIENASVSFSVPHLLSHGLSRVHGAFVKVYDDGTQSIPLIVCSIVDRSQHDDTEVMARYEIPQALLQIVLAYSNNQLLGSYTGYVVTMDRTAVRVGKVVVPQAYLRGLSTSQPTAEQMFFYRSKLFQLLEHEDRREFLRVIHGVLRHLAQSEALQMKIAM